MGHGGSQCPSYEQASRADSDIWEDTLHNSYGQPLDDEAQGTDGDDALLLGISPTIQKNTTSSGYNQLICVDGTGVHQRRVQWCICPNSPEPHIQLFHMRLFPASIRRPSTAFTFNVLDEFYIEAMQNKTSAQGFFSKLCRMTSNAFPSSIPVSLPILFNLSIHKIIVIEESVPGTNESVKTMAEYPSIETCWYCS